VRDSTAVDIAPAPYSVELLFPHHGKRRAPTGERHTDVIALCGVKQGPRQSRPLRALLHTRPLGLENVPIPRLKRPGELEVSPASELVYGTEVGHTSASGRRRSQ